MKLTIDTGTLCKKFGEDKAFEMIKNAGFDGVDYSMCGLSEEYNMLDDNYKENAKKTKALLDKYNLICEQAHAPFSFTYEDSIGESHEKYRDIIRSIEYASIIGCKNLVVHYVKYKVPYDVDYIKYNLDFFNGFIPYLEKTGVKICVENLFRRSSVKSAFGDYLCDPHRHLEFMEKLDSRYFTICLDIGHTASAGFLPEESIKILGKKIAVTHIQDTDYQDDCHMPPYTMKQNWEEIIKAFAESGYEGNISLEIPSFLKRLPDDAVTSGLSFAQAIGRHIVNEINKLNVK